MKPILTLLLFTVTFFSGDVSIESVMIHDPASALKKVKLKFISTDDGATKYSTTNGNKLSLTVANGQVVYMENDWVEGQGSKPLISNFIFGQTSLRDIRKAFGTNGFVCENRGATAITADAMLGFNCFELDSPNNEILALVTSCPLAQRAQLTKDNVADKFKLIAIIISDKKYLDKIWGEKKSYDANYKRVKL